MICNYMLAESQNKRITWWVVYLYNRDRKWALLSRFIRRVNLEITMELEAHFTWSAYETRWVDGNADTLGHPSP